ncbi:ABC transporter substrate-binding protein [Propioniciclava soli]|uniref:ABC transporter substrate-binding protein n=1 Tax=Propioniciclava soli TaxID=2775081 RepID=UPI001E598561|nr:extracellular solute-binding protein [Propioniciclava soli]
MRTGISRRTLIAGGVAGTAVLGLTAGCGGGGTTSGSGAGGDGGDPGTLQFFLSGDANQGGGFAHMAEKYGEETGVTVEIVDIANDDLRTRLRNAAQANALPALARVGAVDPVWMNVTRDLRELVAEHNIMADLATTGEDGFVYSVPTDVTAVGLYLNKTLFDQAGVAYPTEDVDVWSWDEFVDSVRQVQAATGASYGMAMDRSSHRLKSFLYEFGSTLFQPNAEGVFETNDATSTALEYFHNLNDDTFMPRSVWLSEADGNALFKSGDVVSYYSGSWQIADFAENIADFEWVSVYTPRQPTQAVQYGNAASIVVFEGDQADAAYDFVNWLYQTENYRELAETSGFLPATTDAEITYANNQAAFDLYNDEIANAAPVVGEIKQMEIGFEAEGLSTEGDPLRDEVIRYLNDEIDLGTAIQNVSDRMTEAFG